MILTTGMKTFDALIRYLFLTVNTAHLILVIKLFNVQNYKLRNSNKLEYYANQSKGCEFIEPIFVIGFSNTFYQVSLLSRKIVCYFKFLGSYILKSW